MQPYPRPTSLRKGRGWPRPAALDAVGLALGLLDPNDQWATTVPIPVGKFRTFVEAPAEGAYRIVIANNLPSGVYANDAEIREIGFAGPNAAALRVERRTKRWF